MPTRIVEISERKNAQRVRRGSVTLAPAAARHAGFRTYFLARALALLVWCYFCAAGVARRQPKSRRRDQIVRAFSRFLIPPRFFGLANDPVLDALVL